MFHFRETKDNEVKGTVIVNSFIDTFEMLHIVVMQQTKIGIRYRWMDG